MVTQRLLIVTASARMALAAGCSASTPSRHAADAATEEASPVVKYHVPVVAAGDITLAFAGDVHFAGRVARLRKDPTTTFGPITSVLKSADFTAVIWRPRSPVEASRSRRPITSTPHRTSPAAGAITPTSAG